MEAKVETHQVQLLKEMENHPAWRLYLDHLEELCRRKEVEKALALRGNELHRAILRQAEIDGIIIATRSLTNLINGFKAEPE